MEPPPTPSRRRLLTGGLAVVAAGGGAALAGCTRLPGADREPAEPPAPHRDVVLADEAAGRERRLLAAYDLAAERAPDLAERLAPLRAEHAEHLAALGVPDLPGPARQPTDGATPPVAEPGPDAAGEPSAPAAAPPPVRPPPLPADPAALLPALGALERAAGTAHAGAAVRAGRGLAVVLASAAASEASHPVALQ